MKSTQHRTVYLFVLLCGLSLGLAFVTSNLTIAETVRDRTADTSTRASASEEVFVPAGTFLMGCANDLFATNCDSDTHPIHGVHLDAFYTDRTEVTNAQYRACVSAGACLLPLSDATLFHKPDFVV